MIWLCKRLRHLKMYHALEHTHITGRFRMMMKPPVTTHTTAVGVFTIWELNNSNGKNSYRGSLHYAHFGTCLKTTSFKICVRIFEYWKNEGNTIFFFFYILSAVSNSINFEFLPIHVWTSFPKNSKLMKIYQKSVIFNGLRRFFEVHSIFAEE